MDEQTRTFNPPSLQEVLAKFPQSHPRILLDAKDWDGLRACLVEDFVFVNNTTDLLFEVKN